MDKTMLAEPIALKVIKKKWEIKVSFLLGTTTKLRLFCPLCVIPVILSLTSRK